VAEELLFRGLIYRTARDRWGFWRAVVLTSLFFGVVHFEPWSLFGLVGLGALLCLLYERTGSLLAPMATHAVHNAVSFGLMLHWRDQLGDDTAAHPAAWTAAVVCVALLIVLLRRMPASRPVDPC